MMAFNLKKIGLVCLMGYLLLGSARATDVDLPVVELFGKSYYRYEVKKKETLFSLCRRFNITQDELRRANPSLANGLKAGQILLIPFEKQAVTDEQRVAGDQPVTGNNTENDTANYTENNPPIETSDDEVTDLSIHYDAGDLPRITLLLPFEEQATTAINERFVEFYEGFLMAVDSLKSLGLSFEVQALHVGTGTQKMEALMDAGALDQTDYCLGGANPAQIALLSSWARRSRKPTILPFSSRIPEMASNNYLYQPLTSQEKMQERLAAYMSIRFAGSNYVLLKKEGVSTADDTSLSEALKALFNQRGTNYQERVPDETLDELVTSLSDTYENVIVPYDMSLNEATRFVTHLVAAASKQPGKTITLIGYPEWQAMSRRNLPLLNQLNTFVFSSFYADFQQDVVRSFQVNFNQTFGKGLLNTFPKYGMMGYDLASHFIPRMVAEKTGAQTVKGPTHLQHAYGFRPEMSGSGAYNQVFFFIHYTRENRVDVTLLR
jgi:hypothetical protein